MLTQWDHENLLQHWQAQLQACTWIANGTLPQVAEHG